MYSELTISHADIHGTLYFTLSMQSAVGNIPSRPWANKILTNEINICKSVIFYIYIYIYI